MSCELESCELILYFVDYKGDMYFLRQNYHSLNASGFYILKSWICMRILTLEGIFSQITEYL